MGVFSDETNVGRGMSLLKLVRLLVNCFGDASLTCMGSEFGFPDSFDARTWVNGPQAYVRYEDADTTGLRWKHLEMWEACMNRVSMLLKWHAMPNIDIIVQDDKAKLLVVGKAECFFAFNFHPWDEVLEYKIEHPGGKEYSELVTVLNSDEPRFSGRGAANAEVKKGHLPPRTYVMLTLPPRTAVVLASKDAAKQLEDDKVLALTSVDDFVEALTMKTFFPPARK
eukprot:gnl/MRDRNA2_/MRDRNA2_138367_c0_seq1.p1 gnl/MRDRNA2_/MRDRNA2_138367_c0~~gnl/MRDRNA2_/MRDRNA2_138367_c0_seq1.p1  ORF type:complete len:225 (+),score=45.90 gnl/MRDRNA2_/MRDRNA2_138367_c0_seq1:2-676(+)